MSCTILNFLQTSLIASFLDTNIFVSTLQSSILSIPHNISQFWFSIFFQITYSKAKLENSESQELGI